MTDENNKQTSLRHPPEFIYDVDIEEFYESRLKDKTKKQSTGRYEVPLYVKNVYKEIYDAFPDSCPPLFLIDKIIKVFWREVEKELIEEQSVKIFGFGQFVLKKKTVTKTGRDQYYIKFKLSRHFLSRIREYFGTMTESEQKARDKQKDFMKQVWESRMKTKLNSKIYKPIAPESMENKQS